MKNLIDYASQDNGTDFRDALYSAIHDKVAAHIETKKQEIAQGMFGSADEEAELDSAATDKLTKESTDVELDEASREKLTYYISAAKSDEKKDRSTGIRLAQKKKWGDSKYGTTAARVPAVDSKQNEEVEPLKEMENYEAVKATRDGHVKSFMDKTGLPKDHAEQYHSAVVKYPNNAMAGAEQAADRIAGPRMKVKFHQSPKDYQDKHVDHVKTMKGIMNP